MTERKISYAYKKIESCKKEGYLLEALIRNYHLNIHLIKYILESSDSTFLIKGKKIKAIVYEFFEQISMNPGLRSLINKKTLKIVKLWLEKMEVFYKKLKLEQPSNVKELQHEAEKILGILNISANKLFVKNKG